MEKIVIIDNKEMKVCRSEGYNFDFNKKTGFFARWGKTKEEDPSFAPGPEILDLEISYGECKGNCPFCYKENGEAICATHHMSFDEFKNIIDKMPPTLTQIAFGITDIKGNPDFFKMMTYAREKGIIPNYTCHGYDVDEEVAKFTSETCGAVAVSVYNKNVSYNAVKMFTDAGMKQINFHYMLSKETLLNAFSIVDDIASDPRLKGLNAIVFLAYKPKGRNKKVFTTIKDISVYKKLIDYCKSKNVNIGFDSCSAPTIFKSYENTDMYETMKLFGEACEATCFSSYIDANGNFYPCSFTEGEGVWKEGLSVLKAESFKDIWNNDKTIEFRKNLLSSTTKCTGCPSQSFCRTCPTFDMTECRVV